jgi:hypothetical protein
MLVRVKGFGEAHRDLFPESTTGGQAFATVAAAVTQLSAHTVSKQSTAREGRRAKAMARAALLERLDTIGRTARAIAEVAPGFDDPFRVPRRQTDDQLVMTGRVFVQDAEASRSRFLGHRLPETFVADLLELIEKFEQTIRNHEARSNAHAVARAGIAGALLSGLAAVRQLDVIVANELVGDPTALAGWEHERRVTYPNRPRGVAFVPRLASVPPAPQPVATTVGPSLPAAPATSSAGAAVEAGKPASDVAFGVAS